MLSCAIALAVLTSVQTPDAASPRFARMPVRIIPNARPISWNRSSQSLTLFGGYGLPTRSAARRLLTREEPIRVAWDRQLMRYDLESDKIEEVFVTTPDFSLREVEWLGVSSDLVFTLENVAENRTGVVLARKGQTVRTLDDTKGASLMTIATSATLPYLVLCLSGREETRLQIFAPQGEVPLQGVPTGLRVATVGETTNPGYVRLTGAAGDVNSEAANGYAIELETGRVIPGERVPAYNARKFEPAFVFNLQRADVPGVEGPLFDVFAQRGLEKPIFLQRGAVLAVESPDGMKTAIWDGSATYLFEFVRVGR
ncbi:MAG TPA: hypothetical protein PLB31_06215 [Fimbriimonadaceae bacterium]|nr:hypothetical protein [Fimbriimonadaceae bacterium]HRE92742.1 hypothetical protein [Fimbriimonadaceae bacterium]HRI74050.1 hypothetical protein [Fimbriimonadaceae bacterium]